MTEQLDKFLDEELAKKIAGTTRRISDGYGNTQTISTIADDNSMTVKPDEFIKDSGGYIFNGNELVDQMSSGSVPGGWVPDISYGPQPTRMEDDSLTYIKEEMANYDLENPSELKAFMGIFKAFLAGLQSSDADVYMGESDLGTIIAMFDYMKEAL